MASILRMKMARPSIYQTTQRIVRPALSSGASFRSFDHPREGGDGSNSTCRRAPIHFHHRSVSQSRVILSSSSAALEFDHDSSSPSASSSRPRENETNDQIIQIPKTMPIRIRQPRQRRIDISAENNLPKQSSHTTRILFRTLAPHIEYRTLHHLTKQLARIVSRGHHKFDTQDREGKKRALKRRLDMLFETNNNEQPSQGTEKEDATVDYSWGLRGHPWIQQIIYSYFMGKLLDKPQKRAADIYTHPLPHETDLSYPPNRNRRDYEKNLDTLMRAREVSLNHPIFWTEHSMREAGYSFNRKASQDLDRHETKARLEKQAQYREKLKEQHANKTREELQKEVEELLDTLTTKLPPPHFEKLIGALEGFTLLDNAAFSSQDSDEESAHDEKNDANSWCIDEDNNDSSRPLPTLHQSSASHEDWKKHRIPVVAKFLTKCSVSHAHLVAVDLGLYFYADIMGNGAIISKNEKDEEGDQLTAEKDRKAATRALQKQKKLLTMDKRYKKTQTEFVKKMMKLQHDFAHWDSESDNEDVDGANNNDASDDDDVSDDGDVSSDLMVKEFENKPLKREQQEELAETLAELRKLGLRNEDEDGKLTRIQGKGRPKKNIHLEFTAVRIKENDESSTFDTETRMTMANAKESELEERIVFINNLPIDTTEEEIDQIYSRCGPLDSVQLFNLRPDLDPGPLSKKQLEDRRRQNKLRNKNVYPTLNEFRKQRPRTPVYGMLRFDTAEGYKIATSPELCIFGCVIRRHPVLTIKHTGITNLYLEQIPQNICSMDVEYKLAKLLHPHTIAVSLDGMRGLGRNRSGIGESLDNGEYQEYSKPSSCRVKFEDFRTAYQTFQWMREGDDGESETKGNIAAFIGGEECRVQWFPTPENSMGYWTRELNF